MILEWNWHKNEHFIPIKNLNELIPEGMNGNEMSFWYHVKKIYREIYKEWSKLKFESHTGVVLIAPKRTVVSFHQRPSSSQLCLENLFLYLHLSHQLH